VGLRNGKFVLYPIGDCDSGGNDNPPEEPDLPEGDDEEPDEIEEEDPDDPKNAESKYGPKNGTYSGLLLAVVDGTNPDSVNCGFADIGTKRIMVPRCCFPDWNQGRTLFIYLQSDGKGISTKTSRSYPSPSVDKFRRLLGRLIYRNGAYSVVQEQHGPIIENTHFGLESIV